MSGGAKANCSALARLDREVELGALLDLERQRVGEQRAALAEDVDHHQPLARARGGHPVMRVGGVEQVLAVPRARHPAVDQLARQRPELALELIDRDADVLGEVLAGAADEPPVQDRDAIADRPAVRADMVDIPRSSMSSACACAASSSPGSASSGAASAPCSRRAAAVSSASRSASCGSNRVPSGGLATAAFAHSA